MQKLITCRPADLIPDELGDSGERDGAVEGAG